MYDAPQNITMNRKRHVQNTIIECQNLIVSDRINAFKMAKLDRMNRELSTMENIILQTLEAVQRNDRRFGAYNFQNSWVKRLYKFAVNQEGLLYDDWKEQTKIVVSKVRYNDALTETV